MKDIEKKNVILILVVFLVGIGTIAGTYAYLTYEFVATNNNYNTTTAYFDIEYSVNNVDGTNDMVSSNLFPSVGPIGGINGRIGIKVKNNSDLNGIGTIYMHIDNTTDSHLTQTIASYCVDRKTMEQINYNNQNDCKNNNGRWMGYGDSFCENSKTLTRMTDYTDSSTCSSAGGVWRDSNNFASNGVSPLKYAVYNTSDTTQNPVSVGYITTTFIGSNVPIYKNFLIDKEQKYYYIYIWLDGYMTDNTFTELPFKGNIYVSAIQENGYNNGNNSNG